MAKTKYQHKDTQEDFKNWLENIFIATHGGVFPAYFQWWYEEVEKRHKTLREFIGGIRLEKDIKIESNQGPVEQHQIEHFINEILAILPNYLKEYGYTESVFLEPMIRLGTHNAIKLSKHVRTYAQNTLKNDLDGAKKLAYLETTLSKMGEVFARKKTIEEELKITLTTSPRSFALLGHYGPDEDSCFRQGSDKTADKYCLGQSENTFIVVVQKIINGKKVCVSRAFGFFSKDLSVCNVCNVYFSENITEGNVLKAIEVILSELWKQDKLSFFEDICGVKGVFNNPYGRWTWFKNKINRPSEVTPNALLLTTNGFLIKSFRCPKCGQEGRSWRQIDDIICCKYCLKTTNRCELTDELTFKELIQFIENDRHVYFIHPNKAAEFKKCETCENVFSDKDIRFCPICIEYKCSCCEICNNNIDDEQITDVGNLCVCNKCISDNHLEELIETSEQAEVTIESI